MGCFRNYILVNIDETRICSVFAFLLCESQLVLCCAMGKLWKGKQTEVVLIYCFSFSGSLIFPPN